MNIGGYLLLHTTDVEDPHTAAHNELHVFLWPRDDFTEAERASFANVEQLHLEWFPLYKHQVRHLGTLCPNAKRVYNSRNGGTHCKHLEWILESFPLVERLGCVHFAPLAKSVEKRVARLFRASKITQLNATADAPALLLEMMPQLTYFRFSSPQHGLFPEILARLAECPHLAGVTLQGGLTDAVMERLCGALPSGTFSELNLLGRVDRTSRAIPILIDALMVCPWITTVTLGIVEAVDDSSDVAAQFVEHFPRFEHTGITQLRFNWVRLTATQLERIAHAMESNHQLVQLHLHIDHDSDPVNKQIQTFIERNREAAAIPLIK